MKKTITLFLITLSVAGLAVIPGLFSEPSRYEGKIVHGIEFLGLQNTSTEDLIYTIRTTKGYPLHSSEVRKDIRDIFSKGSFESVEVEIEDYNDGVILRFVCKERPKINSIEYKGMDEFVESDFTDTIPLKQGEFYREDFVKKSVDLIRKKYHSEGWFNVAISYKISKPDNDNSINVTFVIDEGEEIKVQKITILGANKIYTGDLVDVMETEEEGLLESGSFKRDVYDQDKSKIIAYYKELGYLDADIVEDKVEYEWTDPVKKDNRGIYIVIKVTEGEKYYFDGYSVAINGKDGKTVFSPKDFDERFELKEKGEIFNDTKFQMDRQMISFGYASRGYIFARVVPNKTVSEREVEVDGVKEKRKYVKIDFTIDEGDVAYVESIIIKGNKKTKDKVIRRELIVKEGELFNAEKMQLSREKVYNLGFFKQVNLDVRPGSREGYMNLIVDVEEQPSGTISLGGGYGTTSGFSIFTDLAENNLFGNGQRVGVKFEYGPTRTSITLSFDERWFMDKPIGFSSSVFYYLYTIETSSLFSDDDDDAEYDKQVFGYSLGFSYRFWYYYTVGITWTHSIKSYLNPTGNAPDDIYQSMALGYQEKRTVTLYSYRDSKDNYLNPTSGWRTGMAIGFSGGYLLGGDDHYIKFDPEISWYYTPFHLPFLKSHPCVIELRANGTFLTPPFFAGSYNKKKPWSANEWLETEDRLFIGGPETIRGWDYYDVDLPTSWTYAGLYHRMLYGAEFRVPVHPQMLWLAFFFDAGALFSDSFWENQLSSSSEAREAIQTDRADKKLYRIDEFFRGKVNPITYFKYSYGIGFRIQIPMMPLRFWFGKKVEYTDGAFRNVGDMTFQFAIGDTRY